MNISSSGRDYFRLYESFGPVARFSEGQVALYGAIAAKKSRISNMHEFQVLI
jgi:hypothetical protein